MFFLNSKNGTKNQKVKKCKLRFIFRINDDDSFQNTVRKMHWKKLKKEILVLKHVTIGLE